MHEDLALQISPLAVIIAIDIFAKHRWKLLTSDIPGVNLQILDRDKMPQNLKRFYMTIILCLKNITYRRALDCNSR